MTREQELLDRIAELEEINSALQDKLDMIYAIVSPDDEEAEEEVVEAPPALVQIDSRPRHSTHSSPQTPTNQSPNRA